MSILSRIHKSVVDLHRSAINDFLLISDSALERVNIGGAEEHKLGFNRSLVEMPDQSYDSSTEGIVGGSFSLAALNPLEEPVYNDVRGVLEISRQKENLYNISVKRIPVDGEGNDRESPLLVREQSFTLSFCDEGKATITNIHDTESIVGFSEKYGRFSKSIEEFIKQCAKSPTFETLSNENKNSIDGLMELVKK